jgi:putative oxidoreductase
LHLQQLEAAMPVDTRFGPYGVLILRIALGVMYLMHSIVLKLLTLGLPGTAAFFVKVGLPGWLAYGTFWAEVIGGTLLLLGIGTRWVALALLLPLAGAIIWVHGANGWLFAAPGGGWEYPAFLIAASLSLALVGDGAVALLPSSASAAPAHPAI